MTRTELAEKLGITTQALHQRKDKPEPDVVLGSGKNTMHLFKLETVDRYLASKKKVKE